MQLLHLVLRQWRQRPARWALSVLSLAIAVATVLGTMLAQQSVRSSYRELSQKVEGKPALDILAAEGGRFDAAAAAPGLSELPGVRAAVPVVSRAGMARAKGLRFRTVLLGLSIDDDDAWELAEVIHGRRPTKADEAVMAIETAERYGVALGTRVTLITRRGPRSATVVGHANAASLDLFAPGATLILPLPTAQDYFRLGEQIDRLRIFFDSADARDAAQQLLERRLPKTLAVQRPAGQLSLTESLVRSTELALNFAGALSVTMAAFIVLNSLRMNFGERRRELATLRTLGATAAQLVRLHLVEGALLGLIGALVGVPAGYFLGSALATGMARLVGGTPTTPELPIGVWAAALVVGPLIAAAAAALPAHRTRSITAREALEGAPPQPPEQFRLRGALLGIAAWSVATVIIGLVIAEWVSPTLAIPAGLIMLVGFIAVLPGLLGPSLRLAARAAAPALGVEGELAVGQLLRHRMRTGLTVGVMVVAVSNGLGLGNAVLSNVADVREWYRRSLTGDAFLVDANAGSTTAPDPALGAALAQAPSVAEAQRVHYLSAQVAGRPATCLVRDFSGADELPWVLDADASRVARAGLRAGEIILGQSLASKAGVTAGDSVRVEVRGRVLQFRVAAAVSDHNSGGMVAFLDRGAVEKILDLGAPQLWIIKSVSAGRKADFDRELTALANEHDVTVRSFGDLRAELDVLMNGVVGALWGLLITGFIVAAVAVANTLTMSIWEQTRELGLLRVVGLTRRQLRKLVASESLLLGIVAAAAGALAGITTAWIIHLCTAPLLGYTTRFTLQPWLVAVILAGCIVFSLLAAAAPGARAARLNLLQAIAYE